MALTSNQVLALSDNVAKGISDYTAAFITNTGTNTPLYSTITSGVSNTGATSGLVGRVLAIAGSPDLPDTLTLSQPVSTVSSNVTSYITGIRSAASYYAQFYPFLNALDVATGGLNAFLTANSVQVNGYFAQAFNAFCGYAVSLGYRGSAPTQISAANYFPYAIVDDLWDITCNTATTFTSNAVGANASTSIAGGGTGQIYIYNTNATNAIGGATFTITYLNGAGSPTTATYATTSGTPAASGSLSTGYAVSGAIGSAITGITGTGMTSGEAYSFGIKLVRSASY